MPSKNFYIAKLLFVFRKNSNNSFFLQSISKHTKSTCAIINLLSSDAIYILLYLNFIFTCQKFYLNFLYKNSLNEWPRLINEFTKQRQAVMHNSTR